MMLQCICAVLHCQVLLLVVDFVVVALRNAWARFVVVCGEVCLPFVVSSSPVFFFSCRWFSWGFRSLPSTKICPQRTFGRIWDGQLVKTTAMDLVKHLFWAIYNDQTAEVTPNGGEK